MSITTDKQRDKAALDHVGFWEDKDNSKAKLAIEGSVQLFDSDGNPISSLGGGGGGGGNNTYTNANNGDFTATVTAGTKNITITGLSAFTLDALNVLGGSIKRISSAGVVSEISMSSIVVSGGVITLADEEDFASGDLVYVTLSGPDKQYSTALDAGIFTLLNPNYAHWTSVETLVSESNLGLTGTCTTGGAASATVIEDNAGGTAMTNANVAVGFLAYSETTDETATVVSVDSTILATTTAVTNWDADVYWLPECARFVIPAEGYNHLSIHTRLTTTNANNAAYIKIYGTLDADAVDTDDTYWVDLSTDIFGAPTLSCTGLTGTQEGIYFVNTPTAILKYMIKVVGEVWDGGAGAIAANTMDVYIKKSS